MATNLEMNKWGVFFSEKTLDHLIHIAPTDVDGWLQNPHTLTLNCKCCPRLEEDMVVHDWVQ